MASENAKDPRNIYFKCENFQKVGAFKFRGAFNAVSKMLESNPNIQSFITQSSGNHGQALALACSLKNVKSYIIMPNTTPKVKQEAVKDYGGEIVLCDNTLESREKECERVQKETKSILIHPYNEPFVIQGQGTIILEVYEQLGQEKFNEIDAVLTPVSGGGLCSGLAICAKSLNKNIRIIGAEPENADDAKRSLESGVLVKFEKNSKYYCGWFES